MGGSKHPYPLRRTSLHMLNSGRVLCLPINTKTSGSHGQLIWIQLRLHGWQQPVGRGSGLSDCPTGSNLLRWERAVTYRGRTCGEWTL